MSERKLATIQRIKSIEPIEGADNIELAMIKGWQVVVRKGEFEPGDFCVYFEIDSLLDINRPEFEFLASSGVKTDAEGNTGHVLKTRKLRGKYSQGLVIPVPRSMWVRKNVGEEPVWETVFGSDPVGHCVSDFFGVIKYEPPIPANMGGVISGPRPGWIPKTDAERIQNLSDDVLSKDGLNWVPTEKIDGTSASYGIDENDKFVVCSRNYELEHNEDNLYWKIARAYKIEEWLRQIRSEIGTQVYAQGEIYGEGIQKNPLKIKGQRFALFNMGGSPAVEYDRSLLNTDVFLHQAKIYDIPVPKSINEALEQVEGLMSLVSPNCQAEGIVWHHVRNKHEPVKAINNKYLLKHDQ